MKPQFREILTAEIAIDDLLSEDFRANLVTNFVISIKELAQRLQLTTGVKLKFESAGYRRKQITRNPGQVPKAGV